MSVLKKVMYFAYLVYAKSSEVNGDIMPVLGPVGGERDDNNCLTGAGFSWCEKTQSCIRRWITPCEDNYSDCNDCLKRQRRGENIACPQDCDTTTVSCENDNDCGNLYFCRPTTMNNDGPKECVRYSKEGDSCGGYTLPTYQSRCHPSFECVNTMGPMIADAPGRCMRPCDNLSVRDDYGNCNNIHDNPRDNIRGNPVMMPEPVLGGIHCGECPPPVPCPTPGPNCNYIPPIEDNCGCMTGCGEINCYAVDPLPMPPMPTPAPPLPVNQMCSEVMCMMYCENGFQTDENGCNMCLCAEPVNQCPLPTLECRNRFVCPKITEITHCSQGGIYGYTTYQLSLIIQPDMDIKNIYAIYGERENRLIIPPAYQIDEPFNTDIGGMSENIIQIDPDSQYDSWLTIGITDGNKRNLISTIGIDFKDWSISEGLNVDNGAIFQMDPEVPLVPGDEYIIGQLTIPSNTNARAVVNVQGRYINNKEGSWMEQNIVFDIQPPENSNNIPEGCTLWYDGCNNCAVVNGNMGGCTRMMCIQQDIPRCIMYEAGHGH
tara:strand:+ start:695 stop:2326 length:1632 start_codon:yes stop_codon:yes gene_type:complete